MGEEINIRYTVDTSKLKCVIEYVYAVHYLSFGNNAYVFTPACVSF